MPTPSIRALRRHSDHHLTLSLAAALGGPAAVTAVCATLVDDDDLDDDGNEEPADPMERENSIAPAAEWTTGRRF